MKKHTVISMDLGITNFGVWVGEVWVHKGLMEKVTTMDSFMLKSTVTDFKSIKEQHAEFDKVLKRLKRRYTPDHITIERFQTRGFRGTTIEYTNVMLGMIVSAFADKTVNIHVVTASSWKNKVNRIFDLKATYKQQKFVGPHRVDAALMGLVVFNDYEYFESVKTRHKFFEGLR